jgi:hypothetical protein
MAPTLGKEHVGKEHDEQNRRLEPCCFRRRIIGAQLFLSSAYFDHREFAFDARAQCGVPDDPVKFLKLLGET